MKDCNIMARVSNIQGIMVGELQKAIDEQRHLRNEIKKQERNKEMRLKQGNQKRK